ncbi:IS1634 family transposase [Mycoplasmopsis verecunda]|uniref:IS1634 family transposase n=1 Tax=Mycoplasmopsis verecunda TaxID=171291 RepID=UPI00298BE426|nr:IS1634 family transposase [Mycoplasmopsis verecunda]WPB54740.1 IS1634 family transposase [Mycoplasmopsis verecunda]
MISNKNKEKDDYYVGLAISAGYGKGYDKSISIGSLSKLSTKHNNPISILKKIAESLPLDADKNYVKNKVAEYFETSKIEIGTYNVGIELLYKVIDEINLFKDINTVKKECEQIFKFLIAKRILEPESLIRSFNLKDKYVNEINIQKSTVYNFLDFVADNKQKLVANINEKMNVSTKREANLIFLDATTLYFETFVNANENLKEKFSLKRAGYSKDGKFKEDQVVLGMVTDTNGIPLNFVLLPGNIAKLKNFYPYNSWIKWNIQFTKCNCCCRQRNEFAQNKDYVKYQNMHYIFPIRLKGESHKFKQYVVSETDYQKVDGLLYKEIQQVDDRAENRIKYRRIIIYDTWKAKRDKILRKEVLDRFDKIKGKDGTATAKSMISYKKYKFFKEIQESKIAIDVEMLKEDAKLDGYVAFETTRYNLTAREIVDIYKKQWTIERNFRDLKSTLDARPMYVRTDNHIFGHITICFLGLVVLNYLTWYINHKQKDKWGVLDRVTPSQIIESIKVANINFTKVDGKITYSSSWDNEIFRNEIELYREIKMLVSDGFSV